jgi:hypothetical protein
MKGVQYLVDDAGNEKSVLIDLESWGDVWETMEDLMIIAERKEEESVSWDEIKRAEDAVHS